MSWDLAYWKGAPVLGPLEVYEALMDDAFVAFVAPLSTAEILSAFRAEFLAEELWVEQDERGVLLRGLGWEAYVAEGGTSLQLSCRWELASDEDRVTQLVRAGLRAGLFVFDPQSGRCWDPAGAAADWASPSFDATWTADVVDLPEEDEDEDEEEDEEEVEDEEEDEDEPPQVQTWDDVRAYLVEAYGAEEDGDLWLTVGWTDTERTQLVGVRPLEAPDGWVYLFSRFATAELDLTAAFACVEDSIFGLSRVDGGWALQTTLPMAGLSIAALNECVRTLANDADKLLVLGLRPAEFEQVCCEGDEL
ncbi:MAG: hypothetical protein ABMA64_19790 [Myxococcota bacterium]